MNCTTYPTPDALPPWRGAHVTAGRVVIPTQEEITADAARQHAEAEWFRRAAVERQRRC